MTYGTVRRPQPRKSTLLTDEAAAELCGRIKQAMADAGMPRPDNGMTGGEVAGLIAPNHYGSTGFSVAHRTGSQYDSLGREHLQFNVVVAGNLVPELRFRHYAEDEDGEELDVHEPVNQAVLHDRIRAVFAGLGFIVIEVADAGYQMHWDYDTEYSVRCEPKLPA